MPDHRLPSPGLSLPLVPINPVSASLSSVWVLSTCPHNNNKRHCGDLVVTCDWNLDSSVLIDPVLPQILSTLIRLSTNTDREQKAVYWRYAAVGTLPDVHAHNHMKEEEGVNE
ncbi:unnamed protein product [Gadus morhua 'NCC']